MCCTIDIAERNCHLFFFSKSQITNIDFFFIKCYKNNRGTILLCKFIVSWSPYVSQNKYADMRIIKFFRDPLLVFQENITIKKGNSAAATSFLRHFFKLMSSQQKIWEITQDRVSLLKFLWQMKCDMSEREKSHFPCKMRPSANLVLCLN